MFGVRDLRLNIIFFKQSIKNVKHLTKTLVKMHQSHMALHWETFNFERLQYGPMKPELVNDLQGCDVLSRELDM